MPRPKKEKPTHSSGRYVYKLDLGQDIHGKRIRKAFYSTVSKADAMKKAEEWRIEQQVAQRTGAPLPRSRVTLAYWARQWLEVYKRPNVTHNTFEFSYRNTVETHIIPALGHRYLDEIRPIDLQNFLTDHSNLSESMLKKLQMCLNGIFETAIDNDLCTKNPAKYLKWTSAAEKRPAEVLGDVEIELCWDFMTAHHWEDIALMLETGVRRGELCGLRWEDVDLQEQVLYIRRAVIDDRNQHTTAIVPPKRNSCRFIPLTPRCAVMLAGMTRSSEYLFPNQKGGPYGPRNWARRFDQRWKAFQSKYPTIPTLTPKQLRHTYGTALRRKGVDIHAIQKLLGHRDIKMTTEIYVHNEVNTLKKALGIPFLNRKATSSEGEAFGTMRKQNPG